MKLPIFRRRYYIYLFYKAKREQISDYIFFDGWSLLIISIIYLIGLLFLFPGKIQLTIPDTTSQVYILETLSRNISIFFGIMFSFVILSFNLFYKHFGRYAFLGFFGNKGIKVSFTLLICSLISCLYSSAYIKAETIFSSYGTFLYLFSFALCISTVLWMFPSVISLLKNTQNRGNIKKLFLRLNENWLVQEFEARYEEKSFDKFYQKDPISILSEIGAAAIKEFDNRTIAVISENLIQYFRDNLVKLQRNEKKGIELNLIYRNFKLLLLNLFQLSVKERNSAASLSIVNARFEMDDIILDNIKTDALKNFLDHDNQYRHWDLDFSVKDYFSRGIQFNEDSVCKDIVDSYQHFIVKSIPLMLPDKFKYAPALHYESASKAFMVFDPMRIVNDLIPEIIGSKKTDLFKPIFTFYFCIEQVIIKLDIDNQTKCFLFNILFNYKFDAFEQYVNSLGTTRISSSMYPFSWTSYHYENSECASVIYGSHKALRMLFAKGKLNLAVINTSKAEMLGLLNLVNKIKGTEIVLLNCIKVFVELGSYIVAEPTDERKELYLNLQENLRVVLRSYNESPGGNTKIEGELQNSIDSFIKYDEFKAALEIKGYLRDSRIV